MQRQRGSLYFYFSLIKTEVSICFNSLPFTFVQAFRWGKLAFGTKEECNEGDPLSLDAFEKCSFGLLSTASKLVERFALIFSLIYSELDLIHRPYCRDRFMCMLQELGICPQASALHGSSPSSPSNHDETSFRESSNGTTMNSELESICCKRTESKGHQDPGKDSCSNIDDFADLKV